MSEYEAFRAAQPGKSTFDPGPSVQDVDRDLREVSESSLERYARVLNLEVVKTTRWEYLPEEQRRAMRAGNELARRQRETTQAATKTAETARVDAEHTARIEGEIATLKLQLRGAFPGTDSQFNAAWPKLLEEYQIEQARLHMNANLDRVRARIRGL